MCYHDWLFCIVWEERLNQVQYRNKMRLNVIWWKQQRIQNESGMLIINIHELQGCSTSILTFFSIACQRSLRHCAWFFWGELLDGEAIDTRGYITIFNYQTAISLTWQPNHHPPLLSSHSREKEKEEEKKQIPHHQLLLQHAKSATTILVWIFSRK